MGLECPWILVFSGILEPLPYGWRPCPTDLFRQLLPWLVQGLLSLLLPLLMWGKSGVGEGEGPAGPASPADSSPQAAKFNLLPPLHNACDHHSMQVETAG
jgi:hypothetical protein